MFILMLSLLGVVMDSRYSCDQYAQVGVAILSMTIIYFVDIVLYWLLVYMGWRGTPLNESKRMPQMAILVHTWVVCVIIKAGFTAYGLFVLYSPRISASCWSDNPCEYYGQTTLQRACVRGATGETTLSPACQVVFPRAEEYLLCAITWSEYGAGWMIENYRGTNETTGDAYFDFPGVVDCSLHDSDIDSVKKYLNQRDLERYDEIISKWPDMYRPDNLYGFLYSFYVIEDAFERYPAKAEAWLENGMTDGEERDILLSDNFISDYMTAGVRYASGNASATIEDTPWNGCMSPVCMELLSQNCTQWRIMVELPNVYRWRGLFETVMYVSVAVIVLTVLIFVLSFNAFPDYQSKESWEGLLSGLARRLERYADYDQTWLSDVGALLYGLFGGVDLDITDLLLGLYLVWLRQKWKRKERVVSELESQGYRVAVQGESVWWSAFGGFLLYPFGLDWRLFSGIRWNKNRDGAGCQSKRASDDAGGYVAAQDDDARVDDDDGQYLTLQHSMATIPSFSPETRETSGSVHIEELQQSRAFLTPLVLGRLEFLGEPPGCPLEELYLGRSQHRDKVDAETLEMLLHYLPFARSSYGLNKGVWKACTKYRWYDWGYRTGDPAYFQAKNYEMLLDMMKVRKTDVMYASYELGTHLKPYLVVVDGDDVVVSIRGTVGAADLITDLLSQPIDDGSGTMYHVGMLSSARAVIADMKAKGIWDGLLCASSGDDEGGDDEGGDDEGGDDEGGDNDRRQRRRAPNQNYKATYARKKKVVMTGHSLGAGLAYLVAVELVRSGAEKSRVACITFNPPGGLSSEASSRLEAHYSVIVNKDAISRMSITTMKRLVDDMMISLSRCNRPKLSILFDGVLLGRYAQSNWKSVFKPLEAMHAEERSVLHTYLQRGKLSAMGAATGDVRKEGVATIVAHQNEYVLPMFPPGKLVFLRMLREGSWDAVWIKAEELMDEGLLVGMRMARDHMLRTTSLALEQAFENCGARRGERESADGDPPASRITPQS